MLRKEQQLLNLLLINAAELIQNRYFENTLTSKLKSKGMLFWRWDLAFVSAENERLWIYSELRKIQYDQGRPPEKSLTETDGPDVWVLHPEQVQDCCLRWSRLNRILQSELDYNSKFSLGPHKIISTPNQQEVAWNTTPTFPTNGLWVFSFVSKNKREMKWENCLYSVNHILIKCWLARQAV